MKNKELIILSFLSVFLVICMTGLHLLSISSSSTIGLNLYILGFAGSIFGVGLCVMTWI